MHPHDVVSRQRV